MRASPVSERAPLKLLTRLRCCVAVIGYIARRDKQSRTFEDGFDVIRSSLGIIVQDNRVAQHVKCGPPSHLRDPKV